MKRQVNDFKYMKQNRLIAFNGAYITWNEIRLQGVGGKANKRADLP